MGDGGGEDDLRAGVRHWLTGGLSVAVRARDVGGDWSGDDPIDELRPTYLVI